MLPCIHDCYIPLMQAASNEAAEKVERAFLQILLMSLNNNNKDVSFLFVVLVLFQLWDVEAACLVLFCKHVSVVTRTLHVLLHKFVEGHEALSLLGMGHEPVELYCSWC